MLLAKLHPRLSAPGLVLLCAVLGSCSSRKEQAASRDAAPSRAASGAPQAEPSRARAATTGAAAAPTVASAPSVVNCPAGMRLIPGGKIWIGSEPSERYAEDESPRFLTELAPYCLDETEVTVSAYRSCVDAGGCSKPVGKQFHCNFRYADREAHPINCVTWRQADAFCSQRGARLPTEAEWEAAARGGQNYFEYSWGNQAPDGRTCWKRAHSCTVKSFAAGAFGLYDMTGNVWEWTADYYGPYPWPPAQGFSRVYRGGSWSRRFEKWLHTRLRNREAEGFSGSHLGLRCAASAPGAKCPFGASRDGRCLAGVLERACPAPKQWNGVRCAASGEPRCRSGRVEVPGHGCVPEDDAAPPETDLAAEKAGVSRSRTPELDPDCRQNFRDRPHAFRYVGGTHRGRNLVSRSAGCKNRDVGVGFNSTCCP